MFIRSWLANWRTFRGQSNNQGVNQKRILINDRKWMSGFYMKDSCKQSKLIHIMNIHVYREAGTSIVIHIVHKPNLCGSNKSCKSFNCFRTWAIGNGQWIIRLFVLRSRAINPNAQKLSVDVWDDNRFDCLYLCIMYTDISLIFRILYLLWYNWNVFEIFFFFSSSFFRTEVFYFKINNSSKKPSNIFEQQFNFDHH